LEDDDDDGARWSLPYWEAAWSRSAAAPMTQPALVHLQVVVLEC
jgi:hypothetical protein